MLLKIGNNQAGGIERGVYYFNIVDYPYISAIEMERISAFLKYEESYNRKTEIICEDDNILSAVNNAITRSDFYEKNYMPEEVEFVYHGTDIESACKILSDGKLLSAVKVYGKTGEELAYEKRESPWNDPADYFEYIMFCNGDDMTGDYLVLSDSFPGEDGLLKGSFNPCVRFYFRLKTLLQHPDFTFDGYHPAKIKDEIVLSDYLHSCIIPERYKNSISSQVCPELVGKVHYLSHDKLSLSDWNKMVYDFVIDYRCNHMNTEYY